MPSARISAGADQHLPGQRDARSQRGLGDLRDAVGHLARTTGEVEGALARDDQVREAGPLAQPDRVHDQVDARLTRGAEGEQGEAEPACRTRALLEGQPAVHDPGPVLQPAVDDGSRSSGMPFCGPNVFVAPNSPVSGLSTSLAATSRTPPTRARATGPRSSVGDPGQSDGAGVETCVEVAPSAASRPAPPSLVPLPPRPTTTVVAPVSTAARTSSPTPYVVADSASTPPVRCRPHAWALSTYAVSPTTSTDRAGSAHRRVRGRSRPAARPRGRRGRTSTKPGPPSDIGARSSSSAGACRAQPVAIASAASTAVSVPANLSGATRTRMRRVSPTTYCRPVGDWTIRPMRPEDVPVVERLSAESFYELDVRTFPPSWPAPVLRPPERADNWNARTAHLLDTDPGGCWVAEHDSGVVGFVVSFRRELMWCLATYAVRPTLQGQGIGRPLLEAALSHSQGCLRGMLSASTDPKALRRYTAAGFSLHPQMWLTGAVDRSALPVVEKVRDGSAADIELMDSLDRRTRGAAHGAPDHLLMLSAMRGCSSPTAPPGRATPTSRRTGLRRAARREQPPHGGPVALGRPRRRRRPDHDQPRHRRQRLGRRGRDGRRSRRLPGRVPGAPRDETAGAVRSPRCVALTSAGAPKTRMAA